MKVTKKTIDMLALILLLINIGIFTGIGYLFDINALMLISLNKDFITLNYTLIFAVLVCFGVYKIALKDIFEDEK